MTTAAPQITPRPTRGHTVGTFPPGAFIVRADGVLDRVKGINHPAGEPERVIVADNSEWIAANARAARLSDFKPAGALLGEAQHRRRPHRLHHRLLLHPTVGREPLGEDPLLPGRPPRRGQRGHRHLSRLRMELGRLHRRRRQLLGLPRLRRPQAARAPQEARPVSTHGTGPCGCRYCRPQPAAEPAPAERPAPVELPDEPRRFRVHLDGYRTQDCTLHPDGRITSVMSGQLWRCAFTFDEMRELDWAEARIEWDPADEPQPAHEHDSGPAAAPAAVQDSLDFTDPTP
ncbi:hypothetical protein [Streptomyces ipomoeae]|uniref:hypothetical protein n=1 Tax=Streptomyces ipomoeae TaxID=103232 RepID=UPI0011476890|nr:hypothetical protein [Streptomyces ipomoeae]TQE33164.1 hypothetical protein Sipo7851_21980 [Streptomyces ipomoeae]